MKRSILVRGASQRFAVQVRSEIGRGGLQVCGTVWDRLTRRTDPTHKPSLSRGTGHPVTMRGRSGPGSGDQRRVRGSVSNRRMRRSCATLHPRATERVKEFVASYAFDRSGADLLQGAKNLSTVKATNAAGRGEP